MTRYLLRNARTLIGSPATARRYLSWLGAKLCGSTPTVELQGGTRIGYWLNFSEFNHYADGISQNEFKLMQGCLREAGPDAIAFDVGANIGLFTCCLGRIGYSQVHAFEPVPETWCRLRWNVEQNELHERVFCNCLAVGEESAILKFTLNRAAPGLNGLAPREGGIRGTMHVPCWSLDDYCEELHVERITFLKIDVEGMELSTLRGAKRLFAENRVGTVLIEVCPSNLGRVGTNVGDLFRQIIQLGLSPFRLNSHGKLGNEYTQSDFEHFISENVVLRPIGAATAH